MNRVNYFDVSSITLKEVTDINVRLRADIKVARQSQKGRHATEEEQYLEMKQFVFREFIDEVRRIKMLVEMNEIYFGRIIPLNIEKEKQEPCPKIILKQLIYSLLSLVQKLFYKN